MQEHDCFPHSHISTSTVCKRSSVQRPRQCSSTWPEDARGAPTSKRRNSSRQVPDQNHHPGHRDFAFSPCARSAVFSCENPSLCNVCVVDAEALTLDRRWLSAELSAAKPLSSALLNSQHIDFGIWGFTESG